MDKSSILAKGGYVFGGKKIIAISLAAIGVLVLSGCSLYGSSTSNNAPATSPTSTQESNNINIRNFAFSPATLTVKKGEVVIWTNNDAAAHQIKSATFNSGLLSKGQTFSFTFDIAGTFDYSCAIHPSMIGKIIVE